MQEGEEEVFSAGLRHELLWLEHLSQMEGGEHHESQKLLLQLHPSLGRLVQGIHVEVAAPHHVPYKKRGGGGGGKRDR